MSFTALKMTPTRCAAMKRLIEFSDHALRDYADHRNYDLGVHQNVSQLSPYLRHRALTEWEVIRKISGQHPVHQLEKFIQEVCWRTYWKGWLEQRPQVWEAYKRSLASPESFDRTLYQKACEGRTGINGFDDWVTELTTNGYLHNHARMWFASIWVFTLRLPWYLGAQFFLRHLLDGDPASNTLSWRWVAGLHTKDKNYLATTENIQKFTRGRFAPSGLPKSARPLTEEIDLSPRPLPTLPSEASAQTQIVFLDDLLGDDDLKQLTARHIGIISPAWDSTIISSDVMRFKQGLVQDLKARCWNLKTCRILNSQGDFDHWCEETKAKKIGVWRPFVGHSHDHYESIKLNTQVLFEEMRRPWDTLFFPRATKGFFAMKKHITSTLHELGVIN